MVTIGTDLLSRCSPPLTDRPLTTCLLDHYIVYRGPAGFCLHTKIDRSCFVEFYFIVLVDSFNFLFSAFKLVSLDKDFANYFILPFCFKF